MQFRDATMNDLPVIVDIYNATIPERMVTGATEAVTVADKTPWFDAHNSFTRPLWMVEVDNQVIGWVSYNNFYSMPTYNGRNKHLPSRTYKRQRIWLKNTEPLYSRCK